MSKAPKNRPTERTVSVVIPTMNEARNIPTVLAAIPAYVDEIVLADANSVDGTVEAALTVRPDLKVVRQARTGKGNAVAAGFEAATGEYIVMIDADGSMDPAEITLYVKALDAGADYVKGSRFLRGGGSDDITALRRAGNWGLNLLTNVLYGTRWTDFCYGFNAFRAEALPVFALPAAQGTEARWGDGFEIESILNLRAARGGLSIDEVPSFEYDRLHGQSNLRTFRDGFRVLASILRERFAPKPAPMRTGQESLRLVDATGMTPSAPPVDRVTDRVA